MKALLQAIGNQWQDIPLITTLKAAPFCFTAMELAAIRLKDNRQEVSFCSLFHQLCEEDTELGHKCLHARQTLETWRLRQKLMPLDQFLWLIYRESGFYAQCDELRQANLRMLAEKAALLESRGHTSIE